MTRCYLLIIFHLIFVYRVRSFEFRNECCLHPYFLFFCFNVWVMLSALLTGLAISKIFFHRLMLENAGPNK